MVPRAIRASVSGIKDDDSHEKNKNDFDGTTGSLPDCAKSAASAQSVDEKSERTYRQQPASLLRKGTSYRTMDTHKR